LVAHNIFYPFLKLAVICKKRKINLLKKIKNGLGQRTLARPTQIRGLPGPGAAESVRRRPIQIGRRADLLPRASLPACDDVGAT
jgi:hypothetical protein